MPTGSPWRRRRLLEGLKPPAARRRHARASAHWRPSHQPSGAFCPPGQHCLPAQLVPPPGHADYQPARLCTCPLAHTHTRINPISTHFRWAAAAGPPLRPTCPAPEALNEQLNVDREPGCRCPLCDPISLHPQSPLRTNLTTPSPLSLTRDPQQTEPNDPVPGCMKPRRHSSCASS